MTRHDKFNTLHAKAIHSRLVFDLRLHPASLSEQDLESLRFFGVTGALLVADSSPSPTADALLEHFETLTTVQLRRFEKAGFETRIALGIHPLSVPARGLHRVLDALPSFFSSGRVVALGLLGLARGGPLEEEAFDAQLQLARRLKLPVIASAPLLKRETMTKQLLTRLRESKLPAERVVVDGANAKTVRLILGRGHVAGLTLHPDQLTVEKAVPLIRALGAERVVLNTAAGDGAGDLLALPRAANRLTQSGLTRSVVSRVAGQNARAFLGLK